MGVIDDLFDRLDLDCTVEQYRAARSVGETVRSWLSQSLDKDRWSMTAKVDDHTSQITLHIRGQKIGNIHAVRAVAKAIELHAAEVKATAMRLTEEAVERARLSAIKTIPTYEKQLADLKKELGAEEKK